MSWNYSGNPADSPKDEVRFLSGDTNQAAAWTLSDQEILYTIDRWSDDPSLVGNNFLAAALCCEAIIAKLKGSLGDKSIGDLNIFLH